MGKMDAYQLLTQICESPIANMVDPPAVVQVAKDLLPPVQAYDGVHQHLRAVAAGL